MQSHVGSLVDRRLINTPQPDRPGEIMITHPSPAVRHARIHGVGSYLPRRVVRNEEVGRLVGADRDWILNHGRTVERRWADPAEDLVGMAVSAAVDALDDSGVPADRIGCVIVATTTRPRRVPLVAAEVARRIGAHDAGAFALSAADAGFCYGLATANDVVGAGSAAYVLLVGVERMTDMVDPHDDSTFLFGDGAGAVVIGPSRHAGFGPVVWGTDSGRRQFPDRQQRSCQALLAAATVGRRALVRAGVVVEQLDAFIPHQVDDRFIDRLAGRLRLPGHVSVAHSIRTAGNTAGASIPLAMHRLLADGQARPGGLALLLGYGAGLTFAGQVVRLPHRTGGGSDRRRATASSTSDELFDRVVEAFRTVSPPGSVEPVRQTSFFTELNGGQLLIAEVLAEVEPGLGAHLPHRALMEIRTVGDLVDQLHQHLGTKRRQR